MASAAIVLPVPGGPAKSRLRPFVFFTTFLRPQRRYMRPLCRSSASASRSPSRVGSARTRSAIVKRGCTTSATGRRGSWTCGAGVSCSSSAWYTSTPASRSRTIRRTSSREMCRQDSRTRPHFGYLMINSSRSFFPIRNPPGCVERQGRDAWRKNSPSYLNMVCADRLRVLPRREFRRHLHGQVQVVQRDLFDVHSERDRGSGLGRRGVQVGPEGSRDLDRRTSRRRASGVEEGLLRVRPYDRAEPDEELQVLVVGDRREAQEDRRGREALGRASLAIRPQDGRHRLRLEQHLRREEIPPP